MRFSTLIIGLFAPLVLAFPFVANKRAAIKEVMVRDVYHYATVIVTVPPAPVELTAYEDYGYIRHRHSKIRQGSPTPAAQFDVLSTTESRTTLTSYASPSVTPAVRSSFVAGFSNLETDEEILTIETAPPTPTSISVIVPQSQIDQASSIISDSESRTIAADITLPSTFIDRLDPTSPVYKGLTLQHHNIHRRNHSAEDLTWNNTLAEYAETTAKTCIWRHDRTPGGGGYGQNIAGGIPAGNITALLTNEFYNGELPFYPEFGTNNPNKALFEKWGHFSQIVWNSTTSVGCYTEVCSPPRANALDCKPDGTSYLTNVPCGNGGIPAIFTVCNYYPSGNVEGQYTNVGFPLGHPTVFVNEDGVQGL